MRHTSYNNAVILLRNKKYAGALKTAHPRICFFKSLIFCSVLSEVGERHIEACSRHQVVFVLCAPAFYVPVNIVE